MQEWINAFGEEIRKRGIRPEEGLGTEIFQFISSLTPIVNVDLLLLNDCGEVLLSWRDDAYCGQGWHIPGGCVRLLETLDKRIHLTALNELGFDVDYDPAPILISEDIAGRRITEYPNMERAHFISLLFRCYAKDSGAPKNLDYLNAPSQWRWFREIPDSFLDVQSFYKSYLSEVLQKN